MPSVVVLSLGERLLTPTVPCKRRTHYAPQGYACRAVQHGKGAGMAATARSEGVRHDGADEEGDGEGGCGYSARGDEGDDAEDEQ